MIGVSEAFVILLSLVVPGIAAAFQARNDFHHNRLRDWGGIRSAAICAMVFAMLTLIILLSAAGAFRAMTGASYPAVLVQTVFVSCLVGVITFCVGSLPALAGYAIVRHRLLNNQTPKTEVLSTAIRQRTGDAGNPYQSPGS